VVRAAVGLLGLALTLVAFTSDAASGAGAAVGAPTPTVAELTGGVTPGFSANSNPDGITIGPDGHIWFTEFSGPGGSSFQDVGPGGVGRVNDDGSVTELVGGKTPGFDRQGGPEAITTGPDRRLWFAEYLDPGRFGIVIEGKVSESTAGVRPGFTANSSPGSSPDGLTTGPGGSVWFTEYTDPGGLGEVVNGTVHELRGGVTRGFSADRGPASVTRGADGHIWFTEQNGPGGVGRVNDDGSVTELTGGVTRGFTKDAHPLGITTGPDGHIWFTEQSGGVGRVNDDGTVSELTGGLTPGFSKPSRPYFITTGPDRHLWFTEYGNPGRLARINDDGSVSEFTTGVTPGFSANAGPTGITSGPDGRIWFAEYDRSGIGRITVGPAVTTDPATDADTDSPTLHGTVRPNAQQTVFHFEYGPTSAYGSETPSAGAGSGTAARSVSARLSGLMPATLYHYRLVATNDTDTAIGTDRTVTTSARGGSASSATDSQAPSAPANLRGRFASGTLRLDWQPASGNTGVDHYRLYRDGRALGKAIPASTRKATVRGFRTSRNTVLSLAAFDAAGNQGPVSSITVSQRRRPRGVPLRIPAWATRLLAFQTARPHGTRPVTPSNLPAWYPRWKAWRLDPYRFVTA
jgi:streptogramin lyase